METETYKVAKDLLDKYGPLEQTSKPAKVSKVHVVTFGALLSIDSTIVHLLTLSRSKTLLFLKF